MVWIEKNRQTEKSIRRRMCRFDMLIGTFLTFFVIVCFVLLLWIGYVSAATIVVNQTSPANISGDFYCGTIKESLNMAEDGDTIIVCPGIYKENIEVDKSVDIRSYAGASETVLEAQYRPRSIFHLTANHVNISGFTVGSIKNRGKNGIYLDTVGDCNVLNNSIKHNFENAIHLHYSSNIGISEIVPFLQYSIMWFQP